MKQGYANVTGRVSPPNRPAKLDRKGNATPMKKEKNPQKTRNPDRTQIEHGRLVRLM